MNVKKTWVSYSSKCIKLKYNDKPHPSLQHCVLLWRSFDRYKENRRVLKEGMKKLGFEEFLSPEHDGYIITSYKFPKDPHFDFKTFYNKLNEKGEF